MRPPERIYLQTGSDDTDCFDGIDFGPRSEVSWCADQIHDSDIEYVIAAKEKRKKRWKDEKGKPQKP